MPLEQDSPRLSRRMPLKEEVWRLLLERIETGEFQPGERLPGETALADEYGISRPTLREILSRLESDGLVRRAHGVGTFVTPRAPRVQTALDLDMGITEAVRASNALLDIDLRGTREEVASPQIAEILELKPDASVFVVERIIRVDGLSAAHAIDMIPMEVVSLSSAPAYDGGSVYQYLERACHVSLLGGVATISAVTADTSMAAALGCRRHSPLLRLDQTEKSVDGVPVLYSQEHYLPGVFNLTVRRLRHSVADLQTTAQDTSPPQSRWGK